jgi:spermidine/putrescine transport system ATP-binding protein
VANQEPAGETGIPVQVRHAVFQGPVIRCSLSALDGTEIVAHVGPEDTVTGLEPGRTLWASWDPDAARLLPPAGYKPEPDTDLRTTVERALP